MKGYITFSVLLIIVLLLGCENKRMENVNIIEEVRRCDAAGLDPQELRDSWSGEVIGVQCRVHNSQRSL